MKNKKIMLLALGTLLATIATNSAMDLEIKELWANQRYTTDTHVMHLPQCPACSKEIQNVSVEALNHLECYDNKYITLDGTVRHVDGTRCESITLWSFDAQKNALTTIKKDNPTELFPKFILQATAPQSAVSSFFQKLSGKKNTKASYLVIKETFDDLGTGYPNLAKELEKKHSLYFETNCVETSLASSAYKLKDAIIVSAPCIQESKTVKKYVSVFGAQPCEFLCKLMPFKNIYDEKICTNDKGSLVAHYNIQSRKLTVFKVRNQKSDIRSMPCKDAHFRFLNGDNHENK